MLRTKRQKSWHSMILIIPYQFLQICLVSFVAISDLLSHVLHCRFLSKYPLL